MYQRRLGRGDVRVRGQWQKSETEISCSNSVIGGNLVTLQQKRLATLSEPLDSDVIGNNFSGLRPP